MYILFYHLKRHLEKLAQRHGTTNEAARAGTGTLTPQRASFPAKTTFLREKSTHKPRRTAQQHDFEDPLVAAAGPALSVLVPIPSLMPCASLVTSYTPLRMFS